MSSFERSIEDSSNSPEERPARRRTRAAPKRPTPARLERWALHHLERYASSAANLKAVLMRRVRRHAEELETDVEQTEEEIDRLIVQLRDRGYVNDGAYAQSVSQRMRSRGASELAIRSRLAARGVPKHVADETFPGSQSARAELEAATRLARRRRLGPFRLDPELREARRERDLAIFGRAGFGYDVARRVVEARDPDELEALSSED